MSWIAVTGAAEAWLRVRRIRALPFLRGSHLEVNLFEIASLRLDGAHFDSRSDEIRNEVRNVSLRRKFDYLFVRDRRTLLFCDGGGAWPIVHVQTVAGALCGKTFPFAVEDLSSAVQDRHVVAQLLDFGE